VKALSRYRPSPAMIVALIALFVAMGGVSYGFATGTIDSREIKDNDVRSRDIRNNEIRTRDLRNNEVRGIDIRNSTIQGRDVALNTITGDDVKEDTLQKVPSATQADSATTATTAGSVAGQTAVDKTVAEGADPVVLATQGPLTLHGDCATGATPRVLVSTTEDNSSATSEGSTGVTSTLVNDIDSADDPVEIARFNGGMAIRALGVADVAAFAPSGKSITGELSLYHDSSGDGACRFRGSLSLQG
jgi:hypothetical protein